MGLLIVLVGVRGAGKTTALQHLKRDGWTVLQPSTTRPRRRHDDEEYDFVIPEEWGAEEKAWTISVGDHNYGMRQSEVARIGAAVALTVFDPAKIDVLREAEGRIGCDVITIGLDTIPSLAEQHSRVANDPTRMLTLQNFEVEREKVRSCDVVLNANEDAVRRAIHEIALLYGRSGVLDGRTISVLIEAGCLLTGADKEKASTASYDLALGEDIWVQGQFKKLTDSDPVLKIPAYSYAIVSAREKASVPTFLVGKFDLKVSLFFQGVILSNGPQVDPGYRGSLFCMLYNGSDTAVPIKRGEHFSTIEFSTLIRKTPGYNSGHQQKTTIEQFMPGHAAAGQGGRIFERLKEDVDKVRDEFKGVKTDVDARANTHLTILIAIFAGLFSLGVWMTQDLRQKVDVLESKVEGASKTFEGRVKEADVRLTRIEGGLKSQVTDTKK